MDFVRIGRLIGCACALSMIAACGGGSGNGSNNPAPTPPGPTASTFTITAGVSGLTASGLVLQNNGGGSIAVPPGATTVTIATGVSGGTTFAVTVQTQPAGQSCSISRGSGLVVNNNVSSISVTCVTVVDPTYTVSGTITDLIGSGKLLIMSLPSFDFCLFLLDVVTDEPESMCYRLNVDFNLIYQLH